MTAKHTPGKLITDGSRFWCQMNPGGRKLWIAELLGDLDSASRQANAARLTHCWNTHDALLEALRFYAGNFPNDDLGNWQERVCADEGDKARAAIKSATESVTAQGASA